MKIEAKYKIPHGQRTTIAVSHICRKRLNVLKARVGVPTILAALEAVLDEKGITPEEADPDVIVIK